MEELIIGFLIGFLAKSAIGVVLDECQFNRDFRRARIELALDKACENSYNHGYEMGRAKGRTEEWERIKREGFPIGEKGKT